jgi:uncharacterized protein YndB with AHSA1/START domain
MHESVPTIGFTSFDHRQPGSNRARPIVTEPTLATWTIPCSNFRVSPASRFMTSPAIDEPPFARPLEPEPYAEGEGAVGRASGDPGNSDTVDRATRGGVMIGIESTVVINRPVQDVFEFVSDQTNEPNWHTDVVEVRAAPDSPKGLGSTTVWVIKFMGRKEYTVEVTGFEQNRRVELTTRAGLMKPTLTYRLEPADGGTRFTRRVDLQPGGAFRIMEPMMRGMVQKGNDRFVRNLKDVLER